MRIIEKLNKSKYDIFWWMIKILFLVIPRYKKTRNIKKIQSINFDECLEYIFWYTHFYLENIIHLAKILRALLSNNNGILHFWKKSMIQ